MKRKKGFVVGLALSFVTTKLLQRGCKGMGYEAFKAGEWVQANVMKAGTFKRDWYKGYAYEDSSDSTYQLRICFVDEDCNNTRNTDTGVKYRIVPKMDIQKVETMDYSKEVDKLFKQVEIDYVLDQKNEEGFNQIVKGDAVE